MLAPSARDRNKIVPAHPPDARRADQQVPLSPQQRTHRLAWAVLLARVFAIEVSQCPTCGGTMRLIAALTAPASIRAYLEAAGLPARPRSIAPPRASPQQELDTLLEVATA